MPAPLAQAVREQIIALAGNGHSARVIEDILAKRGVKVGKTTVADLAKLHRAGGGSAGKPAQVTAPAPPAAAVPAGAPGPPPELAGFDPTAVANLDLEQLARLVQVLDGALSSAIAERDARVGAWLVDARTKVSREIARLRPPTPLDPTKDPANMAARDELRDRLKRLVQSARKSDAGLALLRAHLEKAEEAKLRRDAEPAE